MDQVRLRVQWEAAVELLELRFADLRQGKRVKAPTRERWPEEDLVVLYRPRCVRNDVNREGTRRIYLDYLEEDHQEQIQSWIRKQVCWGRSEFTIWNGKATVRWREGRSVKTASAPCRILDDELWREGKFVERVIRERPGQQKLRRHLLEIEPMCVLSGESTRMVLDVAHLIPHRAKGNTSDRNALLLRADIHRLLDAPKTQPEWLRIAENGTVLLSPALRANGRYKSLRRIRSKDTHNRVRQALAEASRNDTRRLA